MYAGTESTGIYDVSGRRTEEDWNDGNEKMLNDWRHSCEGKAHDHLRLARKYKIMDTLYSLPLVLLPCVTACIITIVPSSCDETNRVTQIVTAVLTLMIGAFNGLYKFKQPATKKQEHLWYEGIYRNVILDIDNLFAQDRKFRQPMDATIAEFRTTMQSLNRTEPDMEPGFCCQSMFI